MVGFGSHSRALAMPDQREPPAPLNGWKEIAAYLGKSVRSVQRWEATLGLPVHRIKTPDGQIVYSERKEIDDWRRRLEAQPVPEPENPADPETLPEIPTPPGDDRRETGGRGAPAWLLAVGIVLIGIGLITGRWISPRSPVAFSVELAGRSVEGLNQKGEVVWSFELDRDVNGGDLKPRLVDLEGDGALEWIVPIRFTVRRIVSEAIFCFSQTGALRWSVQPDQTLTYNGRKVSAPWLLSDFEVAPTVPRRVWAAFTRGEGPNFILEIDPTGSSNMRYFQAGPIATLHHWQTPAGAFLVAGGFSQKHSRPSVVLLAEHGPAAFFPFDPLGMSSRPSCIECPAGEPARVLLFTRSEIETPAHPHTTVDRLRQSGANLVVEMHVDDVDTAHVLVQSDFSIQSFNYSPGHWRAHRELEAQGHLDHTEENCPDRRTSNVFREWTAAGGWQDREIRRGS
jgi:hypothetical protein